ncbi:MAG: hypothetical protein OHK0029_20930 [Armatimonadaceae bacterium]
MSENITHTALFDDGFRLMAASPEICDAFKTFNEDQRRFGRLGGITRHGDFSTVKLLTLYREKWEARTPEDRLEAKLAFVLGWLTHRAADRQMKPVFREAEPNRDYSPSHCSIYHDAFVFHEIYAGGKTGPYHPAMFDSKLESLPISQVLDVPAVEEMFQTLMQRALLELHTFIPDDDNIDGWLDRLFKLRQKFSVDRERYAQAIAQPNPEWYQRFIVEMNFYDRDEPILRTARAIQHGESVAPEEVAAAVAAPAKSHYAQALQMGYIYIRAASDFFVSDMTPDELNRQFKIGELGRDGKPV